MMSKTTKAMLSNKTWALGDITWVILYKYYIPEGGDSKNVHPEEMIIDQDEAKVDNHF